MLDDDQFQTLSVLGFLFRRLGLYDKAGRLYRALLALRPDDPAVLAAAAAAAVAAGEAAAALGFLDRLAHLSPTESRAWPSLFDADRTGAGSPILWLLKAKALAALGRSDEAQAAVQNYLSDLADEAKAR
jgi:tetratricopeptide (TPR) repeat protein